jgi:hypothetical protein
MLRSFKTASNNPLRTVKQVSRRLQGYASLATDIPPVTQTNREQSYSIWSILSERACTGAETSMKRFWKSVHVNAGEGMARIPANCSV